MPCSKMSTLRIVKRCGGKYVTDRNGTYHPFLLWNIVAAAAHLANAIASYTTPSKVSRENMYPVFQDYSRWQAKDDYCII